MLLPTATPTATSTFTRTPTATHTPTATLTSTSTPRPFLRVFVSSSTVTGDLGGLPGADRRCQQWAEAASLGGSWRAWLSSSSRNAKDRIPDIEYRLVDGTTVVANDRLDLVDGIIDNAIGKDELGRAVWNKHPWTGTAWSGRSSGDTCNDWTDGSRTVAGTTGHTSSVVTWTQTSLYDCSQSMRLYCFQTSLGLPTPPHTPPPTDTPTRRPTATALPIRRVFVSSRKYWGNLGGLQGADEKCQALANDAGMGALLFYAWLQDYRRFPESFFANAKYVLVDGTVVANSLSDLTNDTLRHAINKDEYGNTVGNAFVWTGDTSLGFRIYDNCEDWSSAYWGNTGNTGYTSATDGQWRDAESWKKCTLRHRLYCFQGYSP